MQLSPEAEGRSGAEEGEVRTAEPAEAAKHEIEVVVKEVRVGQARGISTPSTRLQDMLICHHSNPVFVTGHMENQHIFVWNLAPAHGSNIGSRSLILNEIRTGSDTEKTVNLFTTFYTLQTFLKLTH